MNIRAISPMRVMFLAVFIAGCAAITNVGLPSPESQLAAGAQVGSTLTVTATTLLDQGKITTVQAKSYRSMIVASRQSMDDANTDLKACRTATGSNEKTTPDPCWARISDVVRIALENITSIKRTLDSKK